MGLWCEVAADSVVIATVSAMGDITTRSLSWGVVSDTYMHGGGAGKCEKSGWAASRLGTWAGRSQGWPNVHSG